ncbi:MAG: tetratricopeptide repeat protein, partial [Stackebrandtia sp.]
VDLFARVAGLDDITAAQHAVVTNVVELCGLLPLAIRISASLLHSRPHWTLETMRDRLLDERGRLRQLESGDVNVSAAFAISYHDLDAEARRVFRVLGLFPGRDFGAAAIAALANRPLAVVEDLLDELFAANLVLASEPDRFGLHDLLRQFAVEAAQREESPSSRERARTRLLTWYRYMAYSAVIAVYQTQPLLPEPPAVPSTEVITFVDAAQGSVWGTTEHRNVLQVVKDGLRHGLVTEAWQVVAAFDRFFESSQHQDEQIAIISSLLPLLRESGHAVAEATLLRQLGIALVMTARSDEGIAAFTRGRDIWRELGEHAKEAAATDNLGITYYRTGRYEQALRLHREAIALARRVDALQEEATAAMNCANTLDSLGDIDEAIVHAEHARELFSRTGAWHSRVMATNNLGYLRRRIGDHFSALALHQEVLAQYQRANVLDSSVSAHINVGDDYRILGRLDDARRHHEEAVGLSRSDGDQTRVAAALRSLGLTQTACGDHREAAENLHEAMRIAERHEDPLSLAEACCGLGDVLTELGETARARHHWHRAAELFSTMDMPEAEEVRRRLTAHESDAARDATL